MTDRLQSLAACVGAETAQRMQEAAIRRSWPHFAQADVRPELVRLDQVAPLARSVYRSRLDKAQLLMEGLREADIAPFASFMEFGDAGVSVCISPLAERHAAGLVLIDGMHRVAAARAAGVETIELLVIESADMPAPALTPCSWADVAAVDEKQSRDVKFPGHDAALFRPTAKVLDGIWGPHQSIDAATEAWLFGPENSAPKVGQEA